MREKKYFGTDGIRGKVGKSLMNAEFMLKLGWSAGKILAQRESAVVLIGKDTRISGYMLESALQAGFSAAGVDTFLLGPMPTPAIAYLTQSIRATAGVVLSASHNPYYDNGVKFFDSKGYKLSDEMELAIEEMIDSPMRTVSSDELGKASRMSDAAGRYIEFCKSTFPSNLNLKGMNLIVDCANGATYSVAPSIFHELGAEVNAIANKPDGYNINCECGATHTEALRKKVLEMHAHVGIALDGDGDRVIMIDENGNTVNGDELLAIITLIPDQAMRPEGVVGTVMSNLGLEQALNQNHIHFIRTKVGDRYVLEQLRQQGWQLGGESSGHIVDLRYTTTGDGVVTALQILRIMQQTGKPLSELSQVMIKRPQKLINVKTKIKKLDLQKYPEIQSAVTAQEQQLGDRGRILLRPSGTEPVVRVMVEGNEANEVTHVAEQLARTVENILNKINV